jgi:hypothetical protein
LEGYLADRVCVDVPRSGWVSLEGFAFQTCSIDHSEHLSTSLRFRNNALRAVETHIIAELCQTSQCAAITGATVMSTPILSVFGRRVYFAMVRK